MNLANRTVWIWDAETCPKAADGIVNDVDPDQTAPIRAV